jgi:16S rRNA (cytidine1402-2'-O)-methyltransferase
MGKAGKLLIVATPIGNLGDITLRALEALKQVDFIAAEDTRRTLKLLSHYGIKKRLISFHEHSDSERMEALLEKIAAGQNCALVSDAGTPLISDPGYLLVKQCVTRGIAIESLPGPCAGIVAVTLSGIDCRRFLFVGFLSPRQTIRQKELRQIAGAGMAAVIYESPNRVLKTLGDICVVMGKKTEVCVLRELSKIHEEVVRGTAAEVSEILEKRDAIKGEFVLVVGRIAEENEIEDAKIIRELEACITKGMTKKEAVMFVAIQFGLPRNSVYRLLFNQM